MVWLQWEQRKILASFFSNMAVLYFGAALVSPLANGFYSVLGLTKNIINGILLLILSLRLIEEKR